ncbi:ABC transporter substrate-binding protein [Actinomadura formosensis]|uniref:ABC transporter substrate-binding protein n=1 Tax=Actinomadura formosensis TaxID=60706 RepID=UPI000A0685FB|nr:ABC transporter substrate-binding protein [Actinomadura formosensis]
MKDSVVRDGTELLVTGPDATVLRLGLLLPLSGPLGLTGPSGLSAACLAAAEVNAAGGAAGRPVELVPVNAGRAPGAVAAEARFLADAGLVQAFVGFHTSDVHRALEAALTGRVPYVFTPPHEGGPRRPGVVLLGDSPERQLGPALHWLSERLRLRTTTIRPDPAHRDMGMYAATDACLAQGCPGCSTPRPSWFPPCALADLEDAEATDSHVLHLGFLREPPPSDGEDVPLRSRTEKVIPRANRRSPSPAGRAH